MKENVFLLDACHCPAPRPLLRFCAFLKKSLAKNSPLFRFCAFLKKSLAKNFP